MPKRKLVSPPEKIRAPHKSLRARFTSSGGTEERIFAFRKKLRDRYRPR